MGRGVPASGSVEGKLAADVVRFLVRATGLDAGFVGRVDRLLSEPEIASPPTPRQTELFAGPSRNPIQPGTHTDGDDNLRRKRRAADDSILPNAIASQRRPPHAARHGDCEEAPSMM